MQRPLWNVQKDLICVFPSFFFCLFWKERHHSLSCYSVHCIFPLLQVPHAAGERGGSEPTQPALPCHPDIAGSTRRCSWERHRAHGQRDQSVAAMGGEPVRRTRGPSGAGWWCLGCGCFPRVSGQLSRVPFLCIQPEE